MMHPLDRRVNFRFRPVAAGRFIRRPKSGIGVKQPLAMVRLHGFEPRNARRSLKPNGRTAVGSDASRGGLAAWNTSNGLRSANAGGHAEERDFVG